MEKIIINIFAEQFGCDPNSITLDMHVIDDFDSDSLDVVELVVQLEEKFNVALEQDEYLKARTVREIIALVKSKLPEMANG